MGGNAEIPRVGCPLFAFFFLPTLRFHGEFDAFRGNQDGAGFGLREVADDVEGLEVAAELLQMQDRDGEQQPHVVSAVEGGRDRVDVQQLPELEGVTLEGDMVGIDLGAETAVALQALQGVAEALRDEITVGRIDFRVLQLNIRQEDMSGCWPVCSNSFRPFSSTCMPR